jgi:hypothetical protein
VAKPLNKFVLLQGKEKEKLGGGISYMKKHQEMHSRMQSHEVRVLPWVQVEAVSFHREGAPSAFRRT